MHTKSNTQSGFTLVELLTVIAIIAVLTAIIVPTYGKVRENAIRGRCASNLQQIQVAVRSYRMDHKRYPASLFELATGKYISNNKVVGCGDDEEQPGALTASATVNGKTVLAQSSYDAVEYLGGTHSVFNYYGYFSAVTPAIPTSTSTPEGMEQSAADSPYYRYRHGVAATLPSGISSWNDYPCLYNRNAPGTTIITHCIFHRDSQFETPKQSDIDVAIRLDGSMESALKPLGYNWVTQPPAS